MESLSQENKIQGTKDSINALSAFYACWSDKQENFTDKHTAARELWFTASRSSIPVKLSKQVSVLRYLSQICEVLLLKLFDTFRHQAINFQA